MKKINGKKKEKRKALNATQQHNLFTSIQMLPSCYHFHSNGVFVSSFLFRFYSLFFFSLFLLFYSLLSSTFVLDRFFYRLTESFLTGIRFSLSHWHGINEKQRKENTNKKNKSKIEKKRIRKILFSVREIIKKE